MPAQSVEESDEVMTMTLGLLTRKSDNRATRWTDRPVSLHAGEVWSSSDRPGKMRIRCLEGEVWITQTFDARDTVVHAGETFRASRLGKIVAQALVDSRVEVSPG
jgi:hypothetical protein